MFFTIFVHLVANLRKIKIIGTNDERLTKPFKEIGHLLIITQQVHNNPFETKQLHIFLWSYELIHEDYEIGDTVTLSIVHDGEPRAVEVELEATEWMRISVGVGSPAQLGT